MWRRLFSSPLRTLTAAANLRRPTAAVPSPSLFPRDFSNETVVPKKKVEDVMPIATGHEREEIEAELQGRKVIDIDNPEGPFGTKYGVEDVVHWIVLETIEGVNVVSSDVGTWKEEPAIIKSYYDKRIVGCPGGEGEDEHDVVWFWLEKGKPHECPVCTQYFELEVVGPGGPPDGHGDDDHH